jgi:hypothetical protein
MANQLSLTIGATTISVPINLTAQQTRAVIRRYAIQRGIDTDGRTEIEIAEDVLRSLKKYVADHSLDRQRMELLETQRATMEETLTADNDL